MSLSKVLKISKEEYIEALLNYKAIYNVYHGYIFRSESDARLAAEYLNTKYSILFNML